MSRIENNIREPLLEGGGTGGQGLTGSESGNDQSVDLSQQDLSGQSNISNDNSEDSHDRNH